MVTLQLFGQITYELFIKNHLRSSTNATIVGQILKTGLTVLQTDCFTFLFFLIHILTAKTVKPNDIR